MMKKNICIPLALIIVVLLFVGCSDNETVQNEYDRSWIASVFGDEIPIGHFNLNLLEVQEWYEQAFGFDVWRQFGFEAFEAAFWQAFDQTVAFAIATYKSAELGVGGLTYEQSTDIDEWASLAIGWERDILDFIGLDESGFRNVFAARILHNNLLQYFGRRYDEELFDEEAMLEAFEALFTERSWEHTSFALNIFAHDDIAFISNVHDRLLSGEDFYDLMRRYSIWYEDGQDMGLWQFEGRLLTDNFGQFITNVILRLEPGEFTQILNHPSAPELMLIIRLNAYTKADEAVLLTSFRDEWLVRGRQTVFNALMNEWFEEADVRFNEEAFEDVTLFGW
ncbi:MAG: hypothetical protein FWC95_02565 [Defluviitaleaceae bacterium]|nr:hypothetical protein [Defluviitaleaceae bacterium]